MRGGRSFFLVLCAGLLSACTSGTPTQESADAVGGAAAGSVRARDRERIAAQQAAAERERIAAASAHEGSGGGFDFGRGPIRRKRPAATEETGADESNAERTAQRPGERAPERAAPSVAGRGIRIVWEALAVERDQVENPRFGRRPLRGVAPDLKIVLVSQNHPAAAGRDQGRVPTREQDSAQMAVLSEADLQVLVRGLREAGFYRVSKPTGAVEPQFDDASARGRVTLEVDGVSQTLLSMRRQGTSNLTEDIPRIYSEAKQAIATMRNRTPTLNVLTAGGNKVPTVVPKKRGERRVLTPEEAAQILGEEPPAKPAADGDWLPR